MSIQGHACISFVLLGRCVSRTVWIISLEISIAALLGVGQWGGYSSHKFYFLSGVAGFWHRIFSFFKVHSLAPWIFSFYGFSAVSDLDTFRVSVLFSHFLSCGSLIYYWGVSSRLSRISNVFGGGSKVVWVTWCIFLSNLVLRITFRIFQSLEKGRMCWYNIIGAYFTDWSY